MAREVGRPAAGDAGAAGARRRGADRPGPGRPIRSTSHLDQGLRLATALGDRAMESDFLGWLAVLASNALRFDQAVDYGRRAVDCRPGLGRRRGAAGRPWTAARRAWPIWARSPSWSRCWPSSSRWCAGWATRSGCTGRSSSPASRRWRRATGRRRRSGSRRRWRPCRRSGQPAYEPWHLAHLGWLARLQGEDERALELGRAAVDAERRRCRTPGAARWRRRCSAPRCSSSAGPTRRSRCSSAAGAWPRRRARRPTCCAAWRRWPRPPGQRRRLGRGRRSAAPGRDPARLGLDGGRLHLPVHRAGLARGRSSRSGRGTCWRRCSPSPSGCRGSVRWPRAAWSTRAPPRHWGTPTRPRGCSPGPATVAARHGLAHTADAARRGLDGRLTR